MELINITVAAIIRFTLIIYGTIHDKYMDVKYTDIDYTVFTDAARHIVNGESPYLKDTYKYTPLLAYLVTPNILLHPLFGKCLFCVVDIFVVLVLDSIMKKMKCDKYLSNILMMTCWIFNPFTMTISSRGNAESIQVLLVLLTILFVIEGRTVLAGVFYGLSVHFKLYPIIYSLPYILYIGCRNKPLSKDKFPQVIKHFIRIVLSFDVIVFGLTSLVVFCSVGLLMYSFSMEFIENTYLFHFTRKDTQHNFSPYFYILRMAPHSKWTGIIAFIPQMVSVLWCGLKYYKQLPLACFLQTFAFVSMNKVCTSQYFIWYIALFPIAYPFLRIPWRSTAIMIGAWLLGQAVWLFSAYLLEFRKYDIAVYVWLSSCFFFIINMSLLYKFTNNVQDENCKAE